MFPIIKNNSRYSPNTEKSFNKDLPWMPGPKTELTYHFKSIFHDFYKILNFVTFYEMAFCK